ncbi:MAG: putative collagen-binding domain-containing protein, partial [Candidatus Bathyarchaeia archaeon]
PGLRNIELFVAACRSENGEIAVIYTPKMQNLNLNLSRIKKPFEAVWVSPRREEEVKIGVFIDNNLNLTPPEPGDWLLIVRTVS